MTDRISTKLTELLGIEHPVLLAPMNLVSGGRLAAAVTAAGGFGIIGGGYGDGTWLDEQFQAAGNQPVGVGFITWSLARQPELFDRVLVHGPRAMMFSFGDSEDYVARAREAGATTLWQVQCLEHARQALAAGTDILVVQGQEAGGHGMDRGLMSLLPAVRDLAGPDAVLVAAGGIADGRGLAATLMLGADGVLMGTRFWASTEANGSDADKAQVAGAKGDDTVRTSVFDLARGFDWPRHFTVRTVHNVFSKRWHGDLAGLERDVDAQRAAYDAAVAADDYDVKAVIVGETVDLIDSIKPAADIVTETVSEAAALLRAQGRASVG